MRALLCLLIGVLLGSGITAAVARPGPTISGQSGYLSGYDVRVNRQRACRDPFVWVNGDGTGTIECR